MSSKDKTFKDKKIFKFEDYEYDQSTYSGRFLHFLDVVNPKRFFLSENTIKEALEKVERFKIREEVAKNLKHDIYMTQEEIETLVEQKKIVDSAVHPDTKEQIPFYFRMSGFMLMNTPILFGVLMTKQTPINIAFFQWLNQTYNAGLNYGNRNASSPYTLTDMMKGYWGAVVTSITISVTLNRLFSKATKRMTGAKQIIISTILNWIAVSLANASNVGLMRYKELEQGVSVKDSNGYDHGKSKVAGKLALVQTIATRMAIPLFVMATPITVVSFLKSKNLHPKSKFASVTLELLLWMGALGISLPMAIAMFPQYGKISTNSLEPSFHDLKDEQGNPVTELYFNKGL